MGSEGGAQAIFDPMNVTGIQGDPTTTGRAQTSPWGPQAHYLKELFAQASKLPELQAYTGERVAGFDPSQTAALNELDARYSGPNMITDAQDIYGRTVQGEYLDPNKNPYLQDTYNRALEQSIPSITSGAVSSGRYGSGAAGMLSNDMQSRLANDIYGGNYQRERDRQMQAVAGAPMMSSADQLARYAVGAQRQGQQQAELGGQMAQFSEQQMAPWMSAANRKNLYSGNYGSSVSNTATKTGK